ncbi:zinc-ribbon domain-containing protein [Staphylococcus saccharolyticus]|nr:zinc-ribbon domain-containing protein [Staphylococcus saccharolyticus]MBL7571060.1 zinc-ribbon domain-containing protein [Staphylococcus saccharolyticus]QQB98909.1 zinc-ribbon domain-containing protein [Staphylococcus saccharolyticus]QRJ66877.1 zinc-ribbon domain-containing protein [Staphylococcus saccharolyticus]RTX98385.1 hypothetical protein CD145_02645 [Staphylococcus saccharolyticus]
MNCPKCGQHYHQEDVFCGNCGNKLSYESDVIIKNLQKLHLHNKIISMMM